MHKGRRRPPEPVNEKTAAGNRRQRGLLDQQLRDLDGVGGGALADLVAAAPQAQAVVIGAQICFPRIFGPGDCAPKSPRIIKKFPGNFPEFFFCVMFIMKNQAV